MPRPLAHLRATALVLCALLAACGRADASARQSKVDAGTVAASGTASGTARATATGMTSRDGGARGDTLTDSALVARADRGRVAGPDTAMWVVMLSDFQCPYCKQWHDSSMKRLEREYIAPGKIRFAYLQLPLSSIHAHARAEAEAAMCAGVQNRFWEYSEALFSAQPTVGTMSDVSPLLSRIAQNLRLDEPAFDACRRSKAIKSLVDNDIAQASQSGVRSTPSFIIGEFLVQGALPWTDFRRAIDTALTVRAKRKAP